jgi:hypothetical protein
MNSRTRSHHEAWEAVPWILNGSLSEAEVRAAQEHLRGCADCREALAFEQRLREAMQQPQPRAQPADAEAGWRQLSARLDGNLQAGKEESEFVEAPAETAPPGAAAAAIAALPRRWSAYVSVRWLAAAVIVEALALGVVVTASWSNHPGREPIAVYRTLSQVDAVTPAPTIRVVLAPGVRLEQFGSMLRAAHLQVVAGPSEAGVWSLAPAEDATSIATETALRALRGNPQVRFAEPLELGDHTPSQR